jgi:hypothetical protein
MRRKAFRRLREVEPAPTVGVEHARGCAGFHTALLRHERPLVRALNKLVSPSVPAEKPPPIATFKNSPRAWQAQYKARLAARAAVFGMADNQTGPAEPGVGLLTHTDGRRLGRSRRRTGVSRDDSRVDPADRPGPGAPERPAQMGPRPRSGVRFQWRPGVGAGDRVGACAHGESLTVPAPKSPRLPGATAPGATVNLVSHPLRSDR